MFDDESRRRQFLRWTAVAGGVGLAGCNGGGSGDDEEDEAEEEAEDGETDADSTDTEAEADGGTKTDTETEGEMGTETEGEPGMSMPQVQFGFEYEGGAVTITHEGGDTVQAGNLEVSSGDETALWSNLAGISASTEVAVGESVTLSESTDVWGSDLGNSVDVTIAFVSDGETMGELAAYTTPDGPSIASEIEVEAWAEFAQAFNLVVGDYEDTEDATISVSQRSRGGLESGVESSLESGSGAAPLTMMAEETSGTVIDTGGLRDLSDRIEEAGWRDDFVAGAWDAYDQDDGTYAVPWSISPVGFYYRVDLLDDMGYDVDAIRNWDDVFFQMMSLGEDAVEENIVDDPDNVYLFGIPENDPAYLWRIFTRQLGGDAVNEDGEIAVGTSESTQAVETLQQLYQDGLVELVDFHSRNHFEKLNRGTSDSRHLMTFAGPGFQSELASQIGRTQSDWRIWQPPAFGDSGNRATATGNGGALIIPRQVSESAANRAWDFLDWAIPNRERSARMFREHGVFPAYEEAYDSSAFSTSNSEQFLGGQSPGAFFSSVAPDIEGYRYTADEPAISETINDNIFDAITEGGSPQEVMLEAADAAAAETGRDIA